MFIYAFFTLQSTVIQRLNMLMLLIIQLVRELN